LNRKYKYGLFSGILFAITWNHYFPALSLFFSFIPLLFVLSYLKSTFIEFFKIALLAFIIFHLGSVWWIYKSSIPGFIAVITLNSLFMASVMSLFYIVYTKWNKYFAYFALIVFWLSFEFFHYHWEISWPFMNLGNWLGQMPGWIQWYEYTGVAGGTLWILLVNIFLFESGDLFFQNKKKASGILIIFTIILLIIPIILSNQLISEPDKNKNELSILIVQPDINPYTEKYNRNLFKKQINEQIEMAKENINPQTQLIIYPETSFPLYLNSDSLLSDKNIKKIKSIGSQVKTVGYSRSFVTDGLTRQFINGLDPTPNIDVIAGLYTYRINKNDTLYYNTSVNLSSQENYTLYNKSKLVPAVEKTPFASYFDFLRNINVNFGGITSSLGISKQRKVFKTRNAFVAPVICYESVYGEFVTQFVKNEAEIIAVITNDAWWGDTPAYEQILMHSQIRAIETRRSVVRSANTGISCLIDKYGTIKNALPKDKKAILPVLADKNNSVTFYVKNGDFIGRYSVYVSVMILLFLGLTFIVSYCKE